MIDKAGSDRTGAGSRMSIILLVFVVGLVFAAALIWAVYSYARFAEQSRGEPSFCLPTDGVRTPLMEDLHKFVASPEATTGLAMVSSNLDAFAARSLSARRAGRSLDLMYHIWHSDLQVAFLPTRCFRPQTAAFASNSSSTISMISTDSAYLALDDHPNIEFVCSIRAAPERGACDAGWRWQCGRLA